MVLRKLFSIDNNVNGRGPVICAWRPEGTFLAMVGSNKRITIVDRQGKQVHSVALPGQGPPVAAEWDYNGELLAVLQQGGPQITIFNINTKQIDNVDTGMKEVTFMKWSVVGPQLVAGNAKGNIMMYNAETLRKVPIMGLHAKKVSAGCWNRKNHLCLSGEDRKVSFLDAEGNCTNSLTVKSEPTIIKFSDAKSDSKQYPKVTMIVGGTSIILHQADSTEPPYELTFNQKYGKIMTYEWFGEGYLLIGTSSGHALCVSTQEGQVGGEISALKCHRDALTAITYNKNLRKGASAGDNAVRVFDMDDMNLSEQKSEKYELDNEFGALTDLQWTDDGQILVAASKNGNVYGFLTRIPVLSDAYQNYVLYLSSLREMSVKDIITEEEVAKIPIEIEPSQVSIGPGTAAITMNNMVHYFSFAPGDAKSKKNYKELEKKMYPSVVEQVKLTSRFTAILSDGKVLLHALGEGTNNPPQKGFPEKDGLRITAMDMTENFLIFATDQGTLTVFSLADYQVVTEYRHSVGIRSVTANLHGTRLFLIDVANSGYVFNPATEVIIAAERFTPNTQKVLWDPADYGVLVGIEPNTFTTYVYYPNTRFGSNCEPVEKYDGGKINTTARPYGFSPVLLFRGVVVCQMPTGSLANITLNTHLGLPGTSGRGEGGDTFINLLKVNRLAEAFLVAQSAEQIQLLAERALHVLDTNLAIRCYRQLGNPAMVVALERIRHVYEKNLLLGHVALAFRNYNDAQNFFMRSSQPMAALEMRRDLMQWDQAVQLAERMAPDQVPLISKEYAQQLEFRNEATAALQMYQRGHINVEQLSRDPAVAGTATAHNQLCAAGVARCLIRTGKIQQGLQQANAVNSKQLFLECASILEELKQWEECAQMYAKAELYEKSATIYIEKAKNLKAVDRILSKITSRNVLVMYAKAKEIGEQAYADAEEAYARAEDWDNVVRLKVEKSNDLHGAYLIVRKTRSTEAAAVVASRCRKKGDIGPAVEFLLLAKKNGEAFELAKSSNAMSAFEQALLSQTPLKDGLAPKERQEDFTLVARFYDDAGKPDLAGDYYNIAGNFPLALQKYLQIGTDEFILKAISVVGRARSDALTHRLLDFLMGEDGKAPKDPQYIFRLYMALGNWEKVGRTAVIIATKEQELGNYREAHKILVDTALALQQKGIRLGSDMRRSLMIVHSYLIVRHLVKPMEDHYGAALMLLRVARNIKKFPKHMGQILTSCVIECQKNEMKASAYEYAIQIVQNEQWRSELAEKHKKKVDTLVRKRGKEELTDPPEPLSPCPICQTSLPQTTLECPACQNTIPFCIVTGRHMVLDDWCQCPNCKFPALHSQFQKLLKDQPQCPMCDVKIDPAKLQKIPNPDPKV